MTNLGAIFELESKKSRIEQLQLETSAPDFWKDKQKAREILNELSTLKELVEKFGNYKKVLEENELLLDLASDGDTGVLAEISQSISDLAKNVNLFEFQIKLCGEHDRLNAIVTLQAGAGGTEACDWCEMLFRMYTRWAQNKNFGIEITDMLPGDEAGIKSVDFIVKGEYAYGLLKSESGVHRLVRISPFDANKRRHTSFAACRVIPEIGDIEVEIDENDLKIETFRSSGPGGQHMQKTESAVRITHVPTGIIVQCQSDRSQYRNKLTALKILKSRLYELEMKKRQELKESFVEKTEIAWGNQIRSYVFMPYKLVKDHRTGIEVYNPESVLDGDIDVFISGFLEMNLKKGR